jgi:hypothetical protein
MENKSPFELNSALRSWRENLAQSSAFRGENLNELESHLRDSIAAWQSKGLSEYEAFFVATERIGAGHELQKEFEKVNRQAMWLERLLWMLIGVQAWMFVNGTAGTITESLLLLGWKTPGLDQGIALPLSIVTTARLLLIIASACFCWWLIVRKSGRFSHWVGKKLQSRSSFLGLSISAVLLLIVIQTLFAFFQGYWIWRLGAETFGRRTLFLGHSQVIAHLVQFIVMIVLILALARRRLVSKSA